LFGTPSREDREVADAAIARLGIEVLASRPFTALSGGERQMVLLARALTAEAETLIFDEPTSALDFKNQAIILETVKSLVVERGFSVVFSTHDPAHAIQIASHALLMQSPTDYRFGRAQDILTDSMLSELYAVPLRKLTFAHGARSATTIVPVFGASEAA
ncbi:MAG: ABC transporter ATP-binding protein, partial [Pseudomonadota bacterium]